MKNLNTTYFIFGLLILFSACNTSMTEQDFASDWELVYRNDKMGNGLYGEKAVLLNAARMGYPIRIGFGGRRARDTTKSVEHLAEATFLTITNGNELFAQITPIIGQNPNLDQDSLGIVFRENLSWTIVVGTTGFSDRLMIDHFQDTLVGHRSLPIEVSWFVELPVDIYDTSRDAQTLYSKE